MATRSARLITSGGKHLRSGFLHQSHPSKDALKLAAVQVTTFQPYHSDEIRREPPNHAGRDLASLDAGRSGGSPAHWSGNDQPAGGLVWGARRPRFLLVPGCKEQLGNPASVQHESAQRIDGGQSLVRLADLSSRFASQCLHSPAFPVALSRAARQTARLPGSSQVRLTEALQGVGLEGCQYRRTPSLNSGGSGMTLAFDHRLPYASSASGAHPSHAPHRSLSSAPWDFSGASGWGSFGGSPEPQSHKEDKVLGYTPEQLFGVVADVARYQEFVPWCLRSEVLWTRGNVMEAELEIGFQLLKERYTSRVTTDKPHTVVSTVGNSLLFDFLNCHWEFRPGPVPQSCHLYFSVEFQFKSSLYRQVSDLFFNEVVCCLVASFEQRCAAIHGPARRLENLQRA